MAGGLRSSSRSDDDSMEKLIEKICTNFANKLEAKIEARIGKLDAKLDKLCDSLNDIKRSVSTNCKAISDLQQRIDILDQNSKRNSIRICGIEELPDERLPAVVASFISNKLNVACEECDIDYTYRLESGRNGNTNTPGTIILNFVSNIKRNEVFLSKKQLKNTNYTVYEDLTPARYELLASAKKKHGNTKVWSAGGKIFYWNNQLNKKILIKSKDEL